MTKKQLKEYLKYVDACPECRRKFTRLKVTPSKFWEMVHPAWMLYLLLELDAHEHRVGEILTWETKIMKELGFDHSVVGDSRNNIFCVNDWHKQHIKHARKCILKLYPWKKIKNRIMEQYEEYRDLDNY